MGHLGFPEHAAVNQVVGHIVGMTTIATAEPVSLGGESVPAVLTHMEPHERDGKGRDYQVPAVWVFTV